MAGNDEDWKGNHERGLEGHRRKFCREGQKVLGDDVRDEEDALPNLREEK